MTRLPHFTVYIDKPGWCIFAEPRPTKAQPHRWTVKLLVTTDNGHHATPLATTPAGRVVAVVIARACAAHYLTSEEA